MHHPAALTCAEHATSTEELALFLAMLGFTEQTARKCPRYGTQGCGTRAGYQRHKDRGQTPCVPCDEANSAYMRDYQRTHYNPERRHRRYEAAKARGYYSNLRKAA